MCWWNMMIHVADRLDSCWQYRFWRRASDSMSRSLHMSLGRSWTGVEILVDKFLTEVGAPVEEAASHRLEEGRYFWVAQ